MAGGRTPNRNLPPGDSFTHAVGAADGAVYYGVVARRLDLAVVALGVNGYGTLQEFLVAREEARDLPQAVALLLQLSDSDAIVTVSASRIGRDLERLAREAGFRYVDIGSRFTEQARQQAVFQEDGVHWNQAGHAIAGGVLADALARDVR